MASVKMVQRVSGTRDGVAWPDVGGVLEVSAEEAEGLVAAGVAEAVESSKPSKPSKKAAAPAKRAEKAVTTAVEER